MKMQPESQEAIFQSLETLQQADGYYRWIASRVGPYVQGRTLEIGAGIGSFARWAKKFADEYHVSEVDPRLVEKLKECYPEAFLWDIFEPFPTGKQYDTVVIFNVVEHLENDRAAAQSLHDRLVPGGKLVLMVPAMQFLYGELDKAFGHFRRYTKTSMAKVLKDAGFQILKSEYINTVGMVGWFLFGRILKRQELPAGLCSRFNLVVPLLYLERPLARFLGLSLLMIAQRPRSRD